MVNGVAVVFANGANVSLLLVFSVVYDLLTLEVLLNVKIGVISLCFLLIAHPTLTSVAEAMAPALIHAILIVYEALVFSCIVRSYIGDYPSWHRYGKSEVLSLNYKRYSPPMIRVEGQGLILTNNWLHMPSVSYREGCCSSQDNSNF